MKPSRNEPKGSNDDEAVYFETRGKDSRIVRISYEMPETLKTVVEE